MSQALDVVQSLPFWIISLVTVGLVVVMAVLFGYAAVHYIRKKELLSRQEMMSCIKTGAIVSIGPAISVFVLAMSMVAALGGPVTLMRIGIIGSASTELMAATMGAKTAGVTLGAEAMTMQAMTAALFAMALMSTGYLIFTPILTRGLGRRLQNLIVTPPGQKKPLAAVLLGEVLPVVLFLLLAITQAIEGIPSGVAMATAAVVMLVLNQIGTKHQFAWLKEWATGFAVLAGMVAATLAAHLL